MASVRSSIHLMVDLLESKRKSPLEYWIQAFISSFRMGLTLLARWVLFIKRPLNLLNWAASSPSAGRLPSFPCLAGYLKPAFEPTKPSRTAIVLLALRLESLSYRLNLPIGGGLIPLPFTVPCDLYTDTPIYPKENQLKEERAPSRCCL